MKHSLAKKPLLLAVSGAVMISSEVSVGASALTTVQNTDDYDCPFCRHPKQSLGEWEKEDNDFEKTVLVVSLCIISVIAGMVI